MSTAEDGHQFRFAVTVQGSYSVVGQPGHTDSDMVSEPLTLTVRAWSLREACRVAAATPLASWAGPHQDAEPPAERPQPLLIVADDHEPARTYARDYQLGSEGVGWRYVHSAHQVQGMRDGRYVSISWPATSIQDLDARAEVVEYLRAHGFKLEHE